LPSSVLLYLAISLSKSYNLVIIVYASVKIAASSTGAELINVPAAYASLKSFKAFPKAVA